MTTADHTDPAYLASLSDEDLRDLRRRLDDEKALATAAVGVELRRLMHTGWPLVKQDRTALTRLEAVEKAAKRAARPAWEEQMRRQA